MNGIFHESFYYILLLWNFSYLECCGKRMKLLTMRQLLLPFSTIMPSFWQLSLDWASSFWNHSPLLCKFPSHKTCVIFLYKLYFFTVTTSSLWVSPVVLLLCFPLELSKEICLESMKSCISKSSKHLLKYRRCYLSRWCVISELIETVIQSVGINYLSTNL